MMIQQGPHGGFWWQTNGDEPSQAEKTDEWLVIRNDPESPSKQVLVEFFTPKMIPYLAGCNFFRLLQASRKHKQTGFSLPFGMIRDRTNLAPYWLASQVTISSFLES